jgi:regulator of replication initiation timing
MKETDERMANLQKTVERISQNVGGLNRSLGELIETLIAARLWKLRAKRLRERWRAELLPPISGDTRTKAVFTCLN